MKARLLNRDTILGFVCALVVVVLFNSGVIAQGTATIKALFTRDSAATTVVPAGRAADEQPAPARP
jgi:hypothetical protein